MTLAFALIVVLVVCLAIALVRSIPNVPAPLNWMLPVVILIAGIAAIALR